MTDTERTPGPAAPGAGGSSFPGSKRSRPGVPGLDERFFPEQILLEDVHLKELTQNLEEPKSGADSSKHKAKWALSNSA